MDLKLLQIRAQLFLEIRSFFDSRHYLEVDTPLLATALIPENCLEVFETSWLPAIGSRQQPEKRWLIPSPEIWMKRIAAEHGVDMYQICKCFRNTESRGDLHNPEFTMLEYYTMNADYLQSLSITEELFSHLSKKMPGALNSPAGQPFMRITMEEAFRTCAGFSLSEAASSGRETMVKESRRLGLEPNLEALDDSSAIALLYDLMFIHAVEPALPKDRPVVLLDYPGFMPCLAKKKISDNSNYYTRERWALYINGIELDNCYFEETDPREIRLFFEEEAKLKQRNALVKHHIDNDYWRYFLPGKSAIKSYSGVAMGIDRLNMIMASQERIENVLLFNF
jgi:lysyl-tRNA synthetase class 2